MNWVTVGLWAIVLGALAGCGPSRSSSVSELATASYVALSGHDTVGNHYDITWGPDGGDIVTTNRDGEGDELWFRGARIVNRDVFGEVTDETSARDALFYQTERAALTGRPLPAAFRHKPLTRSLDVSSPHYFGIYAVAWRGTNETDRFAVDTGPHVVAAFPPPPRPAWSGIAESGVPSASVDGAPVSAVVETAQFGLRVSPRYADLHRLRRVSWEIPFIYRSVAPRLVVLRNVRISSLSMPVAFAGISEDNRAELHVGIGILHRNVAFAKGQQARVTERRCQPTDAGVPALLLGAVEIEGPRGLGGRRWADPSLDAALKMMTLVDTGYAGPPIFFQRTRVFEWHPPVAVGAPTVRYGPTYACEGPSVVALVFGGERLGVDRPVCGSDDVNDVDQPFGAVIGLHSLDAKTLLVDLQNNRVCWYN